MNNKGVYCQRAVLSFFLIVYFKGPKWFVVTDNCYWTWHSFNTVKPTLNVCLTSRFTHTRTSHSLAYLMTMLLHCLLYSSIPIFATSSGPLIFRDLSISYSWKTSTITERNQTTVSLTSSISASVPIINTHALLSCHTNTDVLKMVLWIVLV